MAPTPAVVTVGTFDGVHIGHQALIDTLKHVAALRCARAVAITFARHPLAVVRGCPEPPALMPLQQRVALLAAAGADEVIVAEFDKSMLTTSAERFLLDIRERYGAVAIVAGFNNHIGCDRACMLDGSLQRAADNVGMTAYGADEMTVDGYSVSSTAIRAALGEGRVDLAARMLGRCYRIEGKVVEGRRIGRTIGFPTANISPASCLLIPGAGVYAAYAATSDNRRYRAMVNIGRRPTVEARGELGIEAHLIDFGGNLYGQTLAVDFVRKLRDECRFDSVDKLATRLAADRLEVIESLIS